MQVGTLPLDVGRFATALQRGKTADDFIDEALRAATIDLGGFLHKLVLSLGKDTLTVTLSSANNA